MLLATAVSLLLTANPEAALSLAMPSFDAVGYDASTRSAFAEHLVQQIKAEGAQLLSPIEIQSMLGLERQKQLLGCDEASASCMAEIANALGAEALVLGSVTKIDERVQLNFRIITASNGRVVALFTERVDAGEAVFDGLTRAGTSLVQQAALALGRNLVPLEKPRLTRLWWIPAVLGAASAGVSAVFLVQAQQRYDQLNGATVQQPLPEVDARRLRDEGKQQQTIGTVLLVAGGGLLAVGGGLALGHLLGAPPKITTTVTPIAGGAAASIQGSF